MQLPRESGDLKPGVEFAGYRIVSVLGRGGMSVVYLAEHLGLQRKVALKLLAPQLAEDPRFRDRFVRESQVAAGIDHPNVIPIYEAGQGSGVFVHRDAVRRRHRPPGVLQAEGALDPSRTVSFLRQVAGALDAAHARGLVHRDVKPGNVLIARAVGSEAEEHVYLSDFGLTKRAASDSGITGTGQFVGTLDYAAPEQFEGKQLDARTDVYSLGCLLYECLAGHAPFRRDNDAAVMYANLLDDAPPLTEQRPGLPDEIDAVIAPGDDQEARPPVPVRGGTVRRGSRGLGARTHEPGRHAGNDGQEPPPWRHRRGPRGRCLGHRDHLVRSRSVSGEPLRSGFRLSIAGRGSGPADRLRAEDRPG